MVWVLCSIGFRFWNSTYTASIEFPWGSSKIANVVGGVKSVTVRQMESPWSLHLEGWFVLYSRWLVWLDFFNVKYLQNDKRHLTGSRIALGGVVRRRSCPDCTIQGGVAKEAERRCLVCKGLKVHAGKSGIVSSDANGAVSESGAWPCGVCSRKEVANSRHLENGSTRCRWVKGSL